MKNYKEELIDWINNEKEIDKYENYDKEMTG